MISKYKKDTNKNLVTLKKEIPNINIQHSLEWESIKKKFQTEIQKIKNMNPDTNTEKTT